jgi:hypothetical protein
MLQICLFLCNRTNIVIHVWEKIIEDLNDDDDDDDDDDGRSSVNDITQYILQSELWY